MSRLILLTYCDGHFRKRYASFFILERPDGLTTEDLQRDSLHRNGSYGEEGDESQYVDNDSDLDDDFGEGLDIVSDRATTAVHLAHASIGEFFRHDSRGMTAGVGVDINRAEVSIVKTCLSLWCDEKLWEEWRGTTLCEYAAYYWPLHLGKIDLSTTSVEDKRDIGALLIETLRQKVSERWTSLVTEMKEHWIDSDANISVVMKWLNDEDATSDFSPVDKTWVASLTSDQDVVTNMVRVIATQWLQNLHWDSAECCRNIRAHIRRVSNNAPYNSSTFPANIFPMWHSSTVY